MLAKYWLKVLRLKIAKARRLTARGRSERPPALQLETLEDRCLLSAGITEFPVPTASSQPSRIASGPDGNLWFTELTGNQIDRITPAGTITDVCRPHRQQRA